MPQTIFVARRNNKYSVHQRIYPFITLWRTGNSKPKNNATFERRPSDLEFYCLCSNSAHFFITSKALMTLPCLLVAMNIFTLFFPFHNRNSSFSSPISLSFYNIRKLTTFFTLDTTMSTPYPFHVVETMCTTLQSCLGLLIA